MDNKNTETEINQEQLQEELYAEITEHDVSAPIIANRKDQEGE
jgi:hypothetical protein